MVYESLCDELALQQRLRVLSLSYAIQFNGSPTDILSAAALIEFYIQNGFAAEKADLAAPGDGKVIPIGSARANLSEVFEEESGD